MSTPKSGLLTREEREYIAAAVALGILQFPMRFVQEREEEDLAVDPAFCYLARDGEGEYWL